MDERTPVIVGVGEASERIGAAGYAGCSPVELASRAACAAVLDTQAASSPETHLELIAGVRQFEVSHPNAIAPFGRSDNFPRSVAKRLAANPARAILETAGGQGPQHLVNELAQLIGRGELDLALVVGAEAISTMRHLMAEGERRDWAEVIGGQLEDRGHGADGLIDEDLMRHGVRTAVQAYALFENARRARLGLDRDAYALQMGALFAPFTRIAAQNQHAMSQEVFTAQDLATVTVRNRLIADPFPRRMVARDQANQGAAVLVASVRKARELGIPESRWVYLHGAADVAERRPMERQDLSAYPAASLAGQRALEVAGIKVADVQLFDFYSCFPVAVFDICDALGIGDADPRPLTVTGGLPFFGGAGNNYSTHAIATMVRALRATPGTFGFVGANGGYLSKYSVGIYSTRPSAWSGLESSDLQAEVNGWDAPPLATDAADAGVVETYTIDHSRGTPRGILVCRTAAGARFVAMTDVDNSAVVERMAREEPLGAAITTLRDDRARRIVLTFVPSI